MWHVFTVRVEEKPCGWKVHSHREVGTFAGLERPHGKDLVATLRAEGHLGAKVVFSENDAGPGQTAVYVLASTADVPKLATKQLLVMGIGNGPSGAAWPMMALEWKP